MILSLLVTLSVFFLTIFIILKYKHNHWKRHKIPHISPEFFYGNARGIGVTYVHADFWKNMYLKLKSSGPLCGVYLYYEPFAIVTDLDLAKAVLVKDFHIFPNRGLYFNEKDDPASANLFNIEDERWRSLRNKLTPAFTSGKLKLMFPLIAEITDQMVEIVSGGCCLNSLEVRNILSRYAMDVIGNVAFGIDCKSLIDEDTKFYQISLRATKKFTFLKRILTANYQSFARKLKITTIDDTAAHFYKHVVQQTINYRRENEVQRNDFMSILMNSASHLSFNEIVAQSVIFMLAGFETVAAKLTFCLYELSIHRTIQEKVRESIRQVLRKHMGMFTYDAIADMHYLEQCLNETLRKYLPAASARRVAKEDYRVLNTDIVVKKGTTVVIPVHGIHHDPAIYPDPYSFNPDRFSPEETAKRHNFSFIPFGEGNRMCIGFRFAMVEMKIALAKILINFECELDRERTPVPLKFDLHKVLLSPLGGVFIKFNEIKGQKY